MRERHFISKQITRQTDKQTDKAKDFALFESNDLMKIAIAQ